MSNNLVAADDIVIDKQESTVGNDVSQAVVGGKKIERKLSALRDNIATKGQYSYYYGHTLDTEAARREREVALLLQEEAAKTGSRLPLKTEVVVTRRQQAISQFSWSDGKKKVTM